jgi:hypothetical protein
VAGRCICRRIGQNDASNLWRKIHINSRGFRRAAATRGIAAFHADDSLKIEQTLKRRLNKSRLCSVFAILRGRFMRGLLWLAGAAIGAIAGGATAAVFPPSRIVEATHALGVDLSGFTVADLNPIRAAYDIAKGRVQAGTTPEELGFHPSAVVLKMPDLKTLPGAGFTLDPGMRNGWSQTVDQQTRNFNNRMEDVRNYARNPAGWHGAPP